VTAQDVIATENRDSDDGVVCVPVWHLCYSRLRGGGIVSVVALRRLPVHINA
jgi:hypothetical protein